MSFGSGCSFGRDSSLAAKSPPSNGLNFQPVASGLAETGSFSACETPNLGGRKCAATVGSTAPRATPRAPIMAQVIIVPASASAEVLIVLFFITLGLTIIRRHFAIYFLPHRGSLR